MPRLDKNDLLFHLHCNNFTTAVKKMTKPQLSRNAIPTIAHPYALSFHRPAAYPGAFLPFHQTTELTTQVVTNGLSKGQFGTYGKATAQGASQIP